MTYKDMEDIHIRRTADFVNKQVCGTMNNFLGTKINLPLIKSAIVGQLNMLQANDVIKKFRNVEIAEDPNDPGVFKIEVDYAPPVSLSYVRSVFTINGNDPIIEDPITIEEELVRYIENKPW